MPLLLPFITVIASGAAAYFGTSKAENTKGVTTGNSTPVGHVNGLPLDVVQTKDNKMILAIAAGVALAVVLKK